MCPVPVPTSLAAQRQGQGRFPYVLHFVPVPALVMTWPVPPGDKVTHLISPVSNVVQAPDQIIPAQEEPCHLPIGAVTQSLARAAFYSLALTWPSPLPSAGSKNPKIALKLAELQTDHQGKVRAQRMGELTRGMMWARCS